MTQFFVFPRILFDCRSRRSSSISRVLLEIERLCHFFDIWWTEFGFRCKQSFGTYDQNSGQVIYKYIHIVSVLYSSYSVRSLALYSFLHATKAILWAFGCRKPINHDFNQIVCFMFRIYIISLFYHTTINRSACLDVRNIRKGFHSEYMAQFGAYEFNSPRSTLPSNECAGVNTENTPNDRPTYSVDTGMLLTVAA